ncbi:hypothetical protein L596_015710 [Steinernema carpocapsae]|uniref:Ground-like domain-containing protein n=1 Tax=Steinernema carpocapsae TaxID=34508 RepID=A0A4U5NGV3_STECR|nr:hypothetical protein L596_015710 [Steinernema carpocapsae]
MLLGPIFAVLCFLRFVEGLAHPPSLAENRKERDSECLPLDPMYSEEVKREKRGTSACADDAVKRIVEQSFGKDAKTTAKTLTEKLVNHGKKTKKQYLSFCAPNEAANQLLADPAELCAYANKKIVCHVFTTN